MPEEATTSDGTEYAVGGRTYREAAAYVASLVALVRQRGEDADRIPVSLAASGLNPEDQRVLR